MTNGIMVDKFVEVRQVKRKIKEFFGSSECKEFIKSNIDSRCLKLITINSDSIILKANKKLRDYDKDEFYSHIYNFMSDTLEAYGVIADTHVLELVTDITYSEEDYRITIEL